MHWEVVGSWERDPSRVLGGPLGTAAGCVPVQAGFPPTLVCIPRSCRPKERVWACVTKWPLQSHARDLVSTWVTSPGVGWADGRPQPVPRRPGAYLCCPRKAGP